MYLVTWNSNKRNWQKLLEPKIHAETFVAFFLTKQCVLFFSNSFSSLFHFKIYTSSLCFSLSVKYLILHSLKLKPSYLPGRLIKSVLIYLQWCPRSDLKLYLRRTNLCWKKTVDQLLIYCPSNTHRFSGTESPAVIVQWDQWSRWTQWGYSSQIHVCTLE